MKRGCLGMGRRSGSTSRRVRCCVGALLCSGLLGSALPSCASRQKPSGGADSASVQPRDTRILHEDCAVESSNALKEDVNGDGRPDRTSVRDGSMEACRALDFNFDGVVDAWVYLDDAGRVRRKENDYDRDGRVDEVALYRAGELAERHRATTLAGKLDTWHFYEAGKVSRTERDSNGDDYVDQWWEYPEGRAPECPLIHSDVDGDGRPDPGATVDVCDNQYTPEPKEDIGESNGLQPLPDLPTELPVLPTETDTPLEPDPPAGDGAAPGDPQ